MLPLLAALGALSSVGLDYLYTDTQTLYTGCYSQETRAEYNQNVKTLTIVLDSTKNASCDQISRTLEANLIMKRGLSDIYHKIIFDFAYNTTRQLVFENVDITAQSESVIQVYLFSYADIVPLEILIFDEVKSSLGDCFTADSRIEIFNSQLVISLTPTLYCVAQLKTTSGGGGPGSGPNPPGGMLDNTLSSVTLYIAGNSYEIDPDDISDNYATISTFSITLSGVYADIMQLQRISAKLLFTATQAQQSVTFQHIIGQVSVMGLNYGGNQFYDLSIPHYVGLWDGRFVVKIENPPDFSAQQAAISAQVFTHYIFRLVCFKEKTSFTKSLQRNSAAYNPTEKTFEFTCTDGSYAENKQCTEFYASVLHDSFQCSFSTIFYDNQEFVFIEQVVLEKAESCWDDAVVEVQENAICMVVEQRAGAQCKAILDGQLNGQMKLTLTFISKFTAIPDFSMRLDEKFDTGQVKFCVACDAFQFLGCKDLKKELLSNKNLAFEVRFEVYEAYKSRSLYIFSYRVSRGNYKAVSIVAYTMGAAAIIASLCLTVISIVRIVYSLRHKKRLK